VGCAIRFRTLGPTFREWPRFRVMRRFGASMRLVELVECRNHENTGMHTDGVYAHAAPLRCAGLTHFSASGNSPAIAADRACGG
jgi:hypothetical protein